MSFLCRCSAFDYDTENMNSEDIYSSLKGVTEAIQNFSVRSQEDMNDPVQRRDGEEVSQISGWCVGKRVWKHAKVNIKLTNQQFLLWNILWKMHFLSILGKLLPAGSF